MTLAQFKSLLQPGALLDSLEREVNINYNLVGSDNKVSTIAVRITGDNLQQLQNATKITLKIPSNGTIIGIGLQNSILPVRTINREQVGNYYLYTILETDQQPSITTPPESGTPLSDYYITDVIIEPTIDNSGFEGSDYNALANNAIQDRQSEYIQISDRAKKTQNPQNLYSIINDNAILAEVQDSNYTNTAWTRGRYDGTKTDSTQYGGVEPALIGGIFQGAFFPPTYTELQIRALTSADIIYQEYFFTGKLDAPTCEIISSSIFSAKNSTNISATDTTIALTIPFNLRNTTIQPGDLLRLTTGSLDSLSAEILKVLVVRNAISKSISEIDVLRGFGGTPTNSYVTDTGQFRLITSNQFFKLQKNKAQGVFAGKLLVKDSKEIVYVNAGGYSVSGSKA